MTYLEVNLLKILCDELSRRPEHERPHIWTMEFDTKMVSEIYFIVGLSYGQTASIQLLLLKDYYQLFGKYEKLAIKSIDSPSQTEQAFSIYKLVQFYNLLNESKQEGGSNGDMG